MDHFQRMLLLQKTLNVHNRFLEKKTKLKSREKIKKMWRGVTSNYTDFN